MGKPSSKAILEFGEQVLAKPLRAQKTKRKLALRSEWVFGKKLMRDPDEKLLGGVCSGLSAYFGIEDPIWVRLIMAGLIFGMGVGFGLYIILWIVMPDALTASDRLAMRGEDINIQNIGQEMENGIENLQNLCTASERK